MTADDRSPSTGAANGRGGFGARVGRDLGPRVMSGVAIAAIGFGAIWLGVLPLAILAAVVLAVIAWEWGGIVRGGGADGATVLHAAVAVLATGAAAAGRADLGAAVTIVGALVVGALCARRQPLLSALGVAVTGLAGVSLVWLRSDPDAGAMVVLSIVLAVAATDIAAYFSGRLIGGPNLMPRVSPNKTWAGLAGGVAAAAAVGALAGWVAPEGRPLRLLATTAVLALVAQAGDLAESHLKRQFGVKDASALIPGHGGFMDRVDGLVAALLAAGLLALIVDRTAPARAVLAW